MTTPEPLPTQEQSDRFFTEVLPPRSPQPVRRPSHPPPARPAPARATAGPPRPARRRRPRRLRRAAAAVPWGVVWSVVVIGGIVWALLLDSPPGVVQVSDVQDGACTDHRVTLTSERVRVVDCTSGAARARVGGRFWLPFGPYPGLEAATAEGQQQCASDAGGSPASGVLVPVVPTADEWQRGNRVVLCTYLIG